MFERNGPSPSGYTSDESMGGFNLAMKKDRPQAALALSKK
jgi:hypothetical protein